MTEQPASIIASGTGAVGIGRDNTGIISTGAGARIEVSYAIRPEVSWPYRVGVVPPLAVGYQPRAHPGMDLHRLFAEQSSGTAVVTQTRVLSGLGGVGKTQLAAA